MVTQGEPLARHGARNHFKPSVLDLVRLRGDNTEAENHGGREDRFLPVVSTHDILPCR